ncbi:MAG: DNA internalization-related competence protein ComEC/Rec2, partial [Nitrospinota bacterium]
RAAVMGVVFLLSIVIGKEREIYSVIALAAMVLLLEDPVRLFEIGFQLSFSAVFFIVYGYRRLFGSPLLNEENTKPSKEDTLRKFFLSGKKLFFISLIAGLATAPLTAHYFNIVSIISPISNCIVIPLLSVIVPFCLVISLLSLSWKMGAEFLLIVPVELSKVVLSVSEVFAKIPLAFVRVSTPDPLMVFIQLFFLGYGLTVFKMGKINKIQLGVFSSLVVCIVAFHLFFGTAEKKSLKVTYLDVGQGNSALIQTPQKINVLIDGGGAFGEFSLGRAVVAPFLWKRGITSLDYVIGTHHDKDHIGGLLFILKEFKVKEYIDNGRNKEELTTRILKVLREKKIHHRVVRKEESLVFPSGVHILFLKPEKVSTEKKSDNDSGLVIRTSYGKTSWLFNGDISSRVEEEVRNNQNISSTVMDAPHHGSRFSSSASYIEAVSPEFVVFSVGKRNQFGHPNTDVLKRYSESGAAIYRTDHHGAVRFESDGKTLSVHPTVMASTNEHGL